MEPVKYLFLTACVAFFAIHPASGAGADKATTSLELKGLIIPLEQAMLSSRGTGVIKTLKEEGADFHKGDVIFSLDDDAERASVDTQKAVLDKRSWEVESNKKLRGKGGSSEDEERTIIANFKTAEAQVRESEAMLDKKTVRAPFEGVVVRRIRQPGEAVDQYMPVVNVVNLSKVYLETYLPANRLKDVHSGENVEIHVPDLPGRTYTGKVDFVAPVIDPASGEFRIKILLANDDRSLRSGMSAIGLMDVPAPEANAALKPHG